MRKGHSRAPCSVESGGSKLAEAGTIFLDVGGRRAGVRSRWLQAPACVLPTFGWQGRPERQEPVFTVGLQVRNNLRPVV